MKIDEKVFEAAVNNEILDKYWIPFSQDALMDFCRSVIDRLPEPTIAETPIVKDERVDILSNRREEYAEKYKKLMSAEKYKKLMSIVNDKRLTFNLHLETLQS